MRRALALLPIALVLAACGGTSTTAHISYSQSLKLVPPLVDPHAIRSPDFRKNMDTNPANLASAVVTHAFGQLPEYIDNADFRLLPYEMFRSLEPGHSLAKTIRLTTPRTNLVLDTVVTSGLTGSEAKRNAAAYGVGVSLDGRVVPAIHRYWLFYRNNGPQICRIYFPGDLGSLQMAVHSLVLRPLAAGTHRLKVEVVRRSKGSPPALLVTTYVVRVLPRGPNAAERASAPADDAPKPPSQIPLVLAGH